MPFSRRAPGLDFQQFRGDVSDSLRGFLAGLLPLAAAEPVQWSMIWIHSRVPADQMQGEHGNVEFVAAVILEGEKFAGGAAGGQGFQAEVATYPMVFVNDRRAGSELGQIAKHRFGVSRGGFAPSPLGNPFAEELSFGDQR